MLLLNLSISRGQTIKKASVDNKSVIETKDGGLLIFNNFNKLDLFFYIDYRGGTVKTTERQNIFFVNETMLQVLALDKQKFEGKNDIEVLKNQAQSEIDYISDYIKTKLSVKFETMQIGKQTNCLLWSYEMPEKVSKEVKSQLYISFIHKNAIVGVNIAQFSNQSFEEVLDFLKKLVENTEFSDERITLEYLCNKRK
jgi:hypothetical protein